MTTARFARAATASPTSSTKPCYETDFWLRLRDGKGGYACRPEQPRQQGHGDVPGRGLALHGLGQRRQRRHDGRLFPHRPQAGNWKRSTWMRPSRRGRPPTSEGLDLAHGIGNGAMRGRDLKFMAAAFLYNVTGDKTYEDAMAKECAITGPTSEIDNGKCNQSWGAAGVSAVRQEQRAADPLPQLVGEHEGRDHQRGDEEERRQHRQLALAPQQQQRLRLVPEHAGGAGGLHRARHRHRRGREGRPARRR